jgi:hypothetical protein
MKESETVRTGPLVGVKVIVKSTVIDGNPKPVPEAVIVNPVQLSVAVAVPSVFAAAGRAISTINATTNAHDLER